MLLLLFCSHSSRCVWSGKVYRTAAPIKATETDVKTLYNDLGIKELVSGIVISSSTYM